MRIFYFHNPKSAGTSLIHLIRAQLSERSECPLIENNWLDHRENWIGYEKFRGYDLYLGHYGRDIFNTVADKHIPTTSFRAPVSRLISLYNYFRYAITVPDGPREYERHRAVFAAKEMSFEEFVLSEDREITIYTRNHHFRQLTNSGWDHRIYGKIGDAIAFVATMPFYFVCEEQELSLARLIRFLGLREWEFPRLNVTEKSDDLTGIEALSESLIADINAMNSLDIALFDFAVERLKVFKD